MLKFRLATLNSASATSDVLAAWELSSFFIGEATPDILPIDLNNARESYIESMTDEIDQSNYRNEPQMADDELREDFWSSLAEMANSRESELGSHYPLSVNENNCLVKRDPNEVSVVGFCYLVLQFFRAINGETIEIEDNGPVEAGNERQEFDKNFRRIFEFIAGYAVAGKNGGAPFMVSNCRSARQLEGLLQNWCEETGSGRVLPLEEWNEEQRRTKDGKVDCLVHVGGPGTPGDAEIMLVGATVQRNNIDSKIMRQDILDFFGGFFTERPAAFQGVLARPQDKDELTRLKCVRNNCLLFSYEEIVQGMGKRSDADYQLRAMGRLDSELCSLLKTLNQAKFVDDYNVHGLDEF